MRCTFEDLLRQSFLNVRPQLKACILAINRDVLDVQAIGMEPCKAMYTLYLHALQPHMTLKILMGGVVRSFRQQLLTNDLLVFRT